MAPLSRDKRINLLVTDAEREMLDALAEREGVTMSDYLRQHIRRAHREAFGEQVVSAAKKPRGKAK